MPNFGAFDVYPVTVGITFYDCFGLPHIFFSEESGSATPPPPHPLLQGSHSPEEAVLRMNATAQAIDETLHALLGTHHHSDIQASVADLIF